MESDKQVSFSLNLEVVKEPRWFIKVIQFILSIFAFATAVSQKTSTTFSANCASGRTPVSFSYSYPYDLENVCFDLPVCGRNDSVGRNGTFCLLSGSKGPAEFYVFVGVLVFLYSLAALVLYIVFDNMYKKNTRIVIAWDLQSVKKTIFAGGCSVSLDFIISIILTLLWLISSSVWASGVADIKMYTDPADGGIIGPNSKVVECQKRDGCTTDSLGNFASLNVSIIFGFLNFLVWLGNLWFLYKETPWFKVQSKPPSQPGTVTETDPQKV